jgi:hypothetical protein
MFLVLKNGVKSIQTAGYNGACTVLRSTNFGVKINIQGVFNESFQILISTVLCSVIIEKVAH